ncbi:hypothetical protein C8R45DRAFT_1148644 [Mycena sanguinolenta]|nr:hypothetical protein C8R45DRAFT_1148644 [Mycena sanguinolenta]
MSAMVVMGTSGAVFLGVVVDDAVLRWGISQVSRGDHAQVKAAGKKRRKSCRHHLHVQKNGGATRARDVHPDANWRIKAQKLSWRTGTALISHKATSFLEFQRTTFVLNACEPFELEGRIGARVTVSAYASISNVKAAGGNGTNGQNAVSADSKQVVTHGATLLWMLTMLRGGPSIGIAELTSVCLGRPLDWAVRQDGPVSSRRASEGKDRGESDLSPHVASNLFKSDRFEVFDSESENL